MLKRFRLGLWMCLLVGLALQACNLPLSRSGPTATALAATLSSAESTMIGGQTNVASAFPASTVTATPTPLLTPIPTLGLVTSTGANATVTNDSLCWLGPGPAFEVSSAVLAGTRVALIGRGDLDGWWIIQDPIYHDACWMYQQDLKADAGVDLSGLTVFTAPPSPTPTLTKAPKPTITPTP